ncbi:MAG: D-alanyl-D-alanine carboxypeptidase family protein [Oscillospiraceae bacterium]|nr:D-alanyl-D-alanine carboxypeptidase family protein [Oscillospiraceae bacterium]
MTYAEIRRRGAKRRIRYLLLILLLMSIIIFAVVKIVTGIRQRQTIPTGTGDIPVIVDASAETGENTESTELLPVIETIPISEPIISESMAVTPTVPIHRRSSEGGTLHVKQPYLYLRVGHTKQIPLILSNNVTADQVEWSTNNPDMIDIEPDGTVTGLQKGSCNVYASYGEETLEIPVTVRELITIAGCTYVDGILVANKSYALPEDYDPGLLPVTKEAFDALSLAAKGQGLNIYEGSGYRDYAFQVKCYNSMVSGYSKAYADTWSARPGHSEHQTGYTIDCNSIDNEHFADTPEGKWLAANCYKYGFIIRYPKGKEKITGYNYESWHIRYVGREHAAIIHEQDLALEEYLDIDSVYRDGDPDASLDSDLPDGMETDTDTEE